VVSEVSASPMADSKGSGHLSPPPSSSVGSPRSGLPQEEAMDVSSHSNATPARSGKRAASSSPLLSKEKKSPRSMAKSEAMEAIIPLEGRRRSSSSSSSEEDRGCNLCEDPHYGFRCHLHSLNLLPVVPYDEMKDRKSKGLCEHCGVKVQQHLSLCPVLRDARIRYHRLKSEGCLPPREPFKRKTRRKKRSKKSQPQSAPVQVKQGTYPGTSYKEVVSGFHKRNNQISIPVESMFKLVVVQDVPQKEYPSLTAQQFEVLQEMLFNIFTEQVTAGRQSYQTKDVYFDREATVLCCNVESFNFLKESISAKPGFKAVSRRELLRLRTKLQYFKGSLGVSSTLHKLVTRVWMEETGLPLLRKQLELEEDHLLTLERFEQRQEVKLIVLGICEETEKRWKSQNPPLVMSCGFKMVVFHQEVEERKALKTCLQDARGQPEVRSSRADMSTAERLSADLLAVSVVRETDGSTAALRRGSGENVVGGATAATVDGSASTPCLQVEAEGQSQADSEAVVGGSDPQAV